MFQARLLSNAMLTGLTVESYRCFERLRVLGLSRVNLFVGKNNSGKTALLEAIEALVSEDSPYVLYRASLERGETGARPFAREINGVLIDVRHWFFGHELRPGARFSLIGDGQRQIGVSRALEAAPPDAPSPPFEPGVGFMLTIERPMSRAKLPTLPVAPDGYLGAGSPFEWFKVSLRLRPRVFFLTTRPLTPADLQLLWDDMVLTPTESFVQEALRVLDPRIDRVAPTGAADNPRFLALLRGASGPVPLGTLGEGVSRMLSIAMGLAIARGGFLCIDEIESGLHYTNHLALWRLVLETAQEFDVQVFATTHSKDCLEAIAELYRSEPVLAESLSVHRLEAGRCETVRMDARTLAGTVDGGVDVR